MKRMILFTLLLLTLSTPFYAQQRGIQIKVIAKDGSSIPLYSGSYALVVGISNYTNGWPHLPNAVKDALDVKAELETQGFVVTLLKNPTSAQLKNGINNFISTHGLDADNRLLFYFAGHGHTLEKSYGGNVGYIVPADAPLPGRDRSGFVQKAISMENFNTYAHNMDAKHALFLFDSCFSGSIFAMGRAVPADISYKTGKPVRQFITAGNEDEEVPDKSIFKSEFLAALNGEADNNGDGYVTGTELGMFLQDKVVNYSNGSEHPQYGKIRDPQLDKGDFVFVLKPSATVASQPLTVPDKTGGLDLSAYERERTRIAAAKQQWADWQANMQRDYHKIDNMDSDENLPANAKMKMWRDFISNYNDDNPYSNEDEPMRSRGRSRKSYWQNYRPPVIATPPAKMGDMVFVKGGTFRMGSNDYDNEKPIHKVYVNDFYMDKYEVTNQQFCAFLNEKGNRTEGGVTWLNLKNQYCHIVKQGGRYVAENGFENHPVIMVSWYGARACADWAGKRLPTEAEVEYAARGGNKSRGYKYSGSSNVAEVAWYDNNSGQRTHPVGSKQPNELGLYDMSGNVWEWCADWYDGNYYRNSSYDNPKGPASGGDRVLRGGSWSGGAYSMRCASRGYSHPSSSDYGIGFRCVR